MVLSLAALVESIRAWRRSSRADNRCCKREHRTDQAPSQHQQRQQHVSESIKESSIDPVEETEQIDESHHTLEPICPICLQNRDNEAMATPESCNHMFHESCLLRWMESSHECPMCRKPLVGDVESGQDPYTTPPRQSRASHRRENQTPPTPSETLEPSPPPSSFSSLSCDPCFETITVTQSLPSFLRRHEAESVCALCGTLINVGDEVVTSMVDFECYHIYHNHCMQNHIKRMNASTSTIHCVVCQRPYIELQQQQQQSL